MAKQIIGASLTAYKKRIRRPNRHKKNLNKRDKVKTYFG